MFCEIWLNCDLSNHASFFTVWQFNNKQGVCFINEWQPNSQEHVHFSTYESAVELGCCDWCELPPNTSERISEQALSWRVDNVISAAYFTVMTEDRRDKIALIDQSIWHHHDLYEF